MATGSPAKELPKVYIPAAADEGKDEDTPNFSLIDISSPGYRRRYSLQGFEDDSTRQLAAEIFNAWDLSGDGVICSDEIQASGLPLSFAQALGRVLNNDAEGHIYLENLSECIAVLERGDMKSRVKLLVKFMDSDGNNVIAPHEVMQYLKVADTRMMGKLGFVDAEGSQKELHYDDFLRLFEMSDRGEDAIAIFCDQILRTLKDRVTTVRPDRLNRRGSVSMPYHLTRQISHIVLEHSTCNDVSRILRYLNEIPQATRFLVVLVVLQVFLWLWNFFYYRTRGFPLAFCFAKGFGLNLRIFTILLFLTMARSTMGLLYSLPVVHYFMPVGINIQLHSFMGFCLVLHAFGHTFGHIAYQTMHTSGFDNAFTQKSLLRGAGWETALASGGDGKSGFSLVFILLMMAGTALFRSRSRWFYAAFNQLHQVGYLLWLPVLLVHVPKLWPWFFCVGFIMICERLFDRLTYTVRYKLVNSRPCSNGVTYLSVPRAGSTFAGSYYRIKIPELSPTEWHPFSLATSDSAPTLAFFIASAGDWTRGLHELVSDPIKRSQAVVLVQGPFAAPARNALENPESRILLVASGIGITPFFSVMATKVAHELSREADRAVFAALFDEDLTLNRSTYRTSAEQAAEQDLAAVLRDLDVELVDDVEEGGGATVRPTSIAARANGPKVLHVVWTLREPTELFFYLEYVHCLVKHQSQLRYKPVVIVDVYLTGLGKRAEPQFMMTQTLFLLTVAKMTGSYMKIHFGRPDFAQILRDDRPDEVYYCGGEALKKSLEDLCHQNHVHFHPEDFDSGAKWVSTTTATVQGWGKTISKWCRGKKNTASNVAGGTSTKGGGSTKGKSPRAGSSPRNGSTAATAV